MHAADSVSVNIERPPAHSNFRLRLATSVGQNIVNHLNSRRELSEAKKGRYSYFATLIENTGKQYRLIWLIEDKAIYIGVVNTYRDNQKGIR
jgi:hypothetical protein